AAVARVGRGPGPRGRPSPAGLRRRGPGPRRRAGVILLVRHAVAVSRKSWPGDDNLRPLTRRGEQQAAGLVELLSPYPADRILSSPAVRCVATVTPLAEARSLKVETAGALREGRG